MPSRVLLSQMTSKEAGEAIKEADFVILPTGATEQHSLHLPLSVDSIRAEELTKFLAENSDGLKLVVLPTLYYGLSEHHIHFPGTITLKDETYLKALFEIAWSLKQHGAKRFLIANFHGGNTQACQLACLRIERELGMKTYFVHWTSFARDIIDEYAKGVPWGHSGLHETSVILLFQPELVKKEEMREQEYSGPPIGEERPQTKSRPYFGKRYPTGGIGDPRLASAEFAKELVEKTTKRIVEALREDMKYE